MGRRISAALGAVALVTALSGCWPQPGFDAGRSGWNGGETTVTSANVDRLVELWDEAVPGTGGLGPVVSHGDKVFTTRGTTVSSLRSATGALAWQRNLPFAPPADRRVLHGPVVVDNELLVGAEDWALSFPGGRDYELSLANGTIVGSADGATMDLAVANGRVVRQHVSGGTGQYSVSLLGWDFRPVLPAGLGFDPPGEFAIAGGNVAWSSGSKAVVFPTSCPPATSGQYCSPDLQTELGAMPRDIAALSGTRVAYTDASGTLSVLETRFGLLQWTAEVAADRMAVADGTILVSTTDGRLAAFPAAGCGAGTCTPTWTATLAGPGGTPVAAGDVVYVPAGGNIAAFPVDGCGHATCEPLTVLDTGRDLAGAIVDEGRVVASTTDGHLVAFGLPG